MHRLWLFAGRWPCDEHIHMQTSRLIDFQRPAKFFCVADELMGLVHMLMKFGFVLPTLTAAPAVERVLFTFSSH